MAVKIRLSRVGRKNAPFFRVVAVDSRKKRDGEFLDDIGTYDALASKIVAFNEELYKKWIGFGAVPTDTTRKIYRLFKKSGVETPKNSNVSLTTSESTSAQASEIGDSLAQKKKRVTEPKRTKAKPKSA